MSASSAPYYLFVVAVTLLLRLLPSSWRPWLLLVSSLVFYASSGWIGLLLLLILTFFNASVSNHLWRSSDCRRRNVVFWSSIAFNLVWLIGSKYLRVLSFRFFGDAALSPDILSDWIAPIGISFLTVQMMGALADAFTRSGERVRSTQEFFRFVFFFPQMTIGPIGRTTTLLPEIRANALPNGREMAEGFALILQGLVKKFVIADRLDVYVQSVDNPSELYYGSAVLLFSMFLYLIQLYADFSGFSDVAIGSARLLGIKLPPNFNRPFAAESVTEFWRRWHISFSSWLRDYIYLPLFIHFRAGGAAAMVSSLLVTFLICGFWHGIGSTFAIFGVAHGLVMSLELLTKKIRKKIFARLPAFFFHSLAVIYTFTFCAVTSLLFRLSTVSEALAFYRRVLALSPPQSIAEVFAYKGPFMFILTILAASLIFLLDQPPEKLVGPKFPWARSLGLAVLMLILGKGGGGDFIYEQF